MVFGMKTIGLLGMIDFGKRLSREASSFRNTSSGQLSHERDKGPIVTDLPSGTLPK